MTQPLQMPQHTAAVFCGSSHGDDPAFTRMAERLGEEMVRRNVGLVYGGGDVGLMGVIADNVMRLGGSAIGVIPRLLVEREVAHRQLTDLLIVETMHERKRRMYEMADVVIALPGGIGTFEELFEALTWNQLGIHRKPCGLLDVGGYYRPLVELMEGARHHGFLRGTQEAMLPLREDPAAMLDLLFSRVVTP
jgi:uncharacterized protein (TIGR00730 family)